MATYTVVLQVSSIDSAGQKFVRDSCFRGDGLMSRCTVELYYRNKMSGLLAVSPQIMSRGTSACHAAGRGSISRPGALLGVKTWVSTLEIVNLSSG